MNKSRRELKVYAKKALNGKMPAALLSLLAVNGLNVLAAYFVAGLFDGTTTLSIVLYEITLFIVYLILNLFNAGLNYLYLNMARGEEYSFGDLIYFFRHQPDRVVISGLALTVLEIIASLPYNYFWYTAEPGLTMESQMNYLTTMLVVMVLTTVLNTLFSLPFSQVYYLQADDEELSGKEALKQSWKLMKGKKMKLFVLQLSFVPMMILSVFTLYLALLWVLPYMEMSLAEFYRNLRGEFEELERMREQQEPTDYRSLGYRTETEERREDDFNSEA